MGDSAPRISDAEWDVMEVIWNRGPATASEVIGDLASIRDWNHRTIRTLLARLVEKGNLRREERDGRSVYRATVTRHRCVRQAGRSFLDKVFGGDAGSLLAHFVRDADVSPEEVEHLKRLLDEKAGGKS